MDAWQCSGLARNDRNGMHRVWEISGNESWLVGKSPHLHDFPIETYRYMVYTGFLRQPRLITGS